MVDELNHGKEIREIISNTAPEEIQDLQCIESQMAMMSIIARLGYQDISYETILQQLKSERTGFLNTIGSRAMVRVLAQTQLETEKVLSCLLYDRLLLEKSRLCEILHRHRDGQRRLLQCDLNL